MKEVLRVYFILHIVTTSLQIVVCEKQLDHVPGPLVYNQCTTLPQPARLSSVSTPQTARLTPGAGEVAGLYNTAHPQCGQLASYSLAQDQREGSRQLVTRVEVVPDSPSKVGAQFSVDFLTTGEEVIKVTLSKPGQSSFVLTPFIPAKSLTVLSNPPSCFNVTVLTCLVNASNGQIEKPPTTFDEKAAGNHIQLNTDKTASKSTLKYPTKSNQKPGKREARRPSHSPPPKAVETTLPVGRRLSLSVPSASLAGSVRNNREPRALVDSSNRANKDTTPKHSSWLQLAAVWTLSVATLSLLPPLAIMTFFCCRHKNRRNRKLADLPKKSSQLYSSSDISFADKEKESMDSIGYITDAEHPLGSPTVSTFHLASLSSLEQLDGGTTGPSPPSPHTLRRQHPLASAGLQNTLHFLQQQQQQQQQQNGHGPPKEKDGVVGYSKLSESWSTATHTTTQSFYMSADSLNTTPPAISGRKENGVFKSALLNSFPPPPLPPSHPPRLPPRPIHTSPPSLPPSLPPRPPPSNARYSTPILSSPVGTSSSSTGHLSVGSSPVHAGRRAKDRINKSTSPIPVPLASPSTTGIVPSTSKLAPQESLGESSLDRWTRNAVGRPSSSSSTGYPVEGAPSSQLEAAGETSLDHGTREPAGDNGVKYAVVNKRRLRDRPATPFEHPVPRGERPATPYENPYHVLQDPNALPPPLPPRSTSSSPKLPPRSDHMTSHVTSHSSNIAPSISPKPPRRSGQMINHMTPPSPNNSAKSSPNTNHKVSHLTVIADHKISPMTVKAARPTSSSSRTPSPKGGGRRIGQISIEASAPQQQGEGPQREEPGRGGTEAAEKTRSVVRSESGESFHLVLVNDSDSDSATNIAVMTNNTAAADILRDDPTDPNADPTDPSADPTDTTEQLARPDDPRLSEDDRNTPLYHTLEPNRECPIYHELERSSDEEELCSDQEEPATPPLPPRDSPPKEKAPLYERVRSLRGLNKGHTLTVIPSTSVESVSSEEGTYVDGKSNSPNAGVLTDSKPPQTLKLRNGSSTDYESIASPASSPFYHKAASIQNLMAMFEAGRNPAPSPTPSSSSSSSSSSKLAMLKKQGSSNGSHDYETVSSFLGPLDGGRNVSHDYARIGPVPSVEDMSGEPDYEAPWVPEGAERNKLLKIDSQGYASVLRAVDSFEEEDASRDARSATPNKRVTDVEEAWKYQLERGYAPLTLARQIIPKLVSKRPPANAVKPPQDYEVPVNILPPLFVLKKLVRQKAVISGSFENGLDKDSSLSSHRLPSHTRSDGSNPNSPSNIAPSSSHHTRSVSSSGVIKMGTTHPYTNSSEQGLRFSTSSQSKMRLKSTSDGSLNVVVKDPLDEDVFDGDYDAKTIVAKPNPDPRKDRAVSLGGGSPIKPAIIEEELSRPRAHTDTVQCSKALLSEVKRPPPPPVKAKPPPRRSLPGLHISLNQQAHVVV